MRTSDSFQRPNSSTEPEARALVVDDDPAVLRLVAELLSGHDMEIIAAASLAEGAAVLHQSRIDCVITDIALNQDNGLALAEIARSIDPTMAIIVMTGSRAVEQSVHAIRLGVNDYLLKPFTPDQLQQCVRASLTTRRHALELRTRHHDLESRLAEGDRHLRTAIQRLDQTCQETLQALGAALDARDIETHAHSSRVAAYARLLGTTLQMDGAALMTLERGVYLHDIGKIGIPDRILLHPGALSPTEWDIMKTHCEVGYRLASHVEFLREAGPIILAHHEHYDGTGYPRGLRGETIPFGARLFSVIDTLDAVTSERPYRPARSFGEAREEICRGRGTQFDPTIVEAFASVPLDTWEAIRNASSAELPHSR